MWGKGELLIKNEEKGGIRNSEGRRENCEFRIMNEELRMKNSEFRIRNSGEGAMRGNAEL